ncbi:hypothetical protein E4H04_11725 [Candidatus Bathyarchaeota archaeon]|nr:MAG: hypothetical protein E4H04_11725 [Candidatus Bathyarchaeota archaeon]
MVDGALWETITANHSKSSIYAAYTKYTSTMEVNLELMRREFESLEKERNELSNTVLTLNEDRDVAQSGRDKAWEETDNACKKLAVVKDELNNASQGLNNIHAGLAQLSEKNISLEFVSSLVAMDVVDDVDLLLRISTAEKYTLLLKDVQYTEKKLYQIQQQQQACQRETQKQSEELSSVSNQTTIAKSENSLFIDAVDLTKKGLCKYPKKDLIQLFKTIERIEVRGEPKTTLNYLLDRLEKAKEELELETIVVSLKNEKRELENEVATVKGVLKAFRDGVTQPIKDTHTYFQRVMQEETLSAKQAIGAVRSEAENILNSLAQTSASAIVTAQKQGERLLSNVDNGVWQKLFNLSLVLEARIETCIDETDKWGEVKEEAGKYSYYLSQAILLFGPLVKPEAILSLDPWVVKQIAKRIHLYAQKKHAGVKTRFPKIIANREWAISDIYEVQVTSVTEALALIMEDLLGE